MTRTQHPPAGQAVPAHLRRYPRTPVPAGQTTLTTVTLALTAGTQLVAGEATTVPGLVLAPHVKGEPLRYTGDGRLVHAASGLSVTPPAPIAYTREAALWLAAAGIDWDRPGAVVASDKAAQEAFLALTIELDEARYERRPLAYARTSWVAWPPLWRIWRGGKPEPAAYRSYEVAVSLAEIAGSTDQSRECWLAEGAEIRRDTTSPGWALRCAAPSCPDEHAWFVDGWGAATRPAIGGRAGIERDARDVGWRDHDRQHWVCDSCTSQYH